MASPGYAVPLRIKSFVIGYEGFKLLRAQLKGELPLPGQDIGAVKDISALGSDNFDPAKVDPLIVEFFEKTSRFKVSVVRQWLGVFKLAGALYDLFSGAVQQLSPGGDNTYDFIIQETDILNADASQLGTLGTRIIRRVIGAKRRPFYTAVFRPYVAPKKRGGTVTQLQVIFPFSFGNLSVVLELRNLPDGGFRMSARESDGCGIETGMYVCTGGERWSRWWRLPSSGGERLDFTVSREKAAAWVTLEHSAFFLNRRALKMSYEINRKY